MTLVAGWTNLGIEEVKKSGPLVGPEEEDGNGSLLFLCLSNFLNHLRRRARLVHAEGLFGKKVAAGGKGARAASHADMAKFAAAALPFQVVIVTQLIEDHRVGPDVGKALLAQIASQRRQVAAGEDFSLMRDKAHARACKAAFGHGIHVAGMSPRMTRVTNRRSAARLK